MPSLLPLMVLLCGSTLTELKESQPIPYADVIERILVSSGIYNESGLSDPVSSYILGRRRARGEEGGDLAIHTMDLETFRRMLDYIGRATMQRELSARRSTNNEKVIGPDKPKTPDENRLNETASIQLAFDLMEQSIYSTRFRLELTKKFRKRYIGVPSYQVAFLYGSITQLALKMDNYYAQMDALYNCTFYHYLFLYEKILAVSVDITYSVQRLWLLQSETAKQLGAPPDDKAGTSTQPNNNTGSSNAPGGSGSGDGSGPGGSGSGDGSSPGGSGSGDGSSPGGDGGPSSPASV